MSFIDIEDIMALNQKLVQRVWKEIKGVDVGPIPTMTYDNAMNHFGCDKPDIRFAMELQDLTPILKNTGFKVFDDVSSRATGSIKAITWSGGAARVVGKLIILQRWQKNPEPKVWFGSNGKKTEK